MCALTPRQGRDWFGSGPESAAACRAVGFRKIRPKSFLPIIPARSAAKTCGNGRITAIRRIDLGPWSNAQLAAEGFEPALSHWSAWRWPTGKEFARGGKYDVQLNSTNSRTSL